jgi:peptidoglycan-N-acetylmuramic acid deacetylase
MRRVARVVAGVVAAALAGACAAAVAAGCGDRRSDKPVYLTFDTGHMGVAPLVADILARQGVKATFFLADERTLSGGSSLDEQWAPWWKARAAEGHAFGSHTWSHVRWFADEPGGFRMQPSAGPDAGKVRRWTAAEYCAEIERPAARLTAMTGARMLPLFRAPGGRTSAALLAAARACGWTHQGWSAAGFLGDELPSERYPNDLLLARALRDIRPGDVLLAHLGIWSRRDPWAPAVLEPLIAGLKERGFCFATLRENSSSRAPARRVASG